MDHVIAGIVTVALFVYLFYALLNRSGSKEDPMTSQGVCKFSSFSP